MSLFSKKSYVGIDLGHYAIKAVQLDKSPGGWTVSRVAWARTPADTMRDSVVIDPKLLGLAIKNLLKGAHIHATSAAIAVCGGTVVVRPVRIPKMSESALRKSIRFEASRYVPNSVEDSFIEFEITGGGDDTTMDVIVAAAPKDLVQSRVDAVVEAGLDVVNVEIGAFAAHRALIEADAERDWSNSTLALVDVGAQVTNLTVLHNGAFSMTRAIPTGSAVFTDALMSYFKLTEHDAETGKAQLDARDLLVEGKVGENPPLRVLHSHIDDLVREVRRSINYWQSQQGEAPGDRHVEAIVLSGGGAKLPGLPEYFEHKLSIKTLLAGVYDNPRFLKVAESEGEGLDLAIAVGLTMGLAPNGAHKLTKIEAEPLRPSPKPVKGKRGKQAEPEAPTLEAEPVAELDPDQELPSPEIKVARAKKLKADAPAEEPKSGGKGGLFRRKAAAPTEPGAPGADEEAA